MWLLDQVEYAENNSSCFILLPVEIQGIKSDLKGFRVLFLDPVCLLRFPASLLHKVCHFVHRAVNFHITSPLPFMVSKVFLLFRISVSHLSSNGSYKKNKKNELSKHRRFTIPCIHIVS